MKVECEECQGLGKVNASPFADEAYVVLVSCPECYGAGYEERKITLADLKDILNETI